MFTRKILYTVLFLYSQILFAQITFDANFESGNLKSVTTQDSVLFEVETHEDIQGRWFFYRISGVENRLIRVKLLTNPHDFTQAMYSYDDANYIRFTKSESPESGTFGKIFEQDTVYVAYYTPYTFKYLQERIDVWKENSYVTVDTIGYTNHLLPIQELLITDPSIPSEEKLSVWIHSRTHPSETPSSWQFDGIVQELLSNDEVTNNYLQKIEFHLIPFSNPDGVFYGRSRTNFDGIDIESNWDKSDDATSKEVKILKARMKELSDIKPFSVFLNLHSQASSYCTFWIHNASSTTDYFFRREIQFSNLNVSDNPYFNISDYSFSSLRSRYPEGWLWDNYGDQVMALTYETPYNNYHSDSSTVEVTNENLIQIGKRTIYAIAEYLEISHPKYNILDNNIAEITGNYSVYDVETQFFGNDFIALEASGNSNYAIFRSDDLPKGNYNISSWWATNSGNSYESKFIISDNSGSKEIVKTQKINGAQWNHLLSFEHNSDGPIEIKVEGNNTGLVIADAFRLVYTSPITHIGDITVPVEFNLSQNYPNPFNPETRIRYSIPNLQSEVNTSKNVSLIIYDILGREIKTLINKNLSPGKYEVVFNGSNLASGTYIYRLKVGSFIETKKMMLLK